MQWEHGWGVRRDHPWTSNRDFAGGHPWTTDGVFAGGNPWRQLIRRRRLQGRSGWCRVGMQEGADVLDSLELRISRDVGTVLLYESGEGLDCVEELVVGRGVRYGERVMAQCDCVADGGAPCMPVEDGVAAVVVEGRANVVSVLAAIIPRASYGGLHVGECTASEGGHRSGIEVKGPMEGSPS